MTDLDVRTAIVRRLDWASGVRSEHTGIGVTDGAVTLTGEVSSAEERIAALGAAMRTRGVRAVVDHLVVRGGTTVADADIARTVSTIIAEGGAIEGMHFRLEATVRDGVVSLTGAVDHEHDRVVLLDRLAAVPGVLRVAGFVEVRSTPTAREVETEIGSALGRVVPPPVRVALHGTEATLSGTVVSWSDRHRAETTACSVPGISRVWNRITVRSNTDRPQSLTRSG